MKSSQKDDIKYQVSLFALLLTSSSLSQLLLYIGRVSPTRALSTRPFLSLASIGAFIASSFQILMTHRYHS